MASSLKLINEAQRHRGPDDEGYLFINNDSTELAGGKDSPESVLNGNIEYLPGKLIEDVSGEFSIGLGHRRLSILDLSSAGHQPMCSDPDTWIVFNGEVYNYLEIREELKEKGQTFTTSTDTEVILKSYHAWGTDCVDHFNGMWSFVIYDKKKNVIWGSRDITGVKPLYYCSNEDFFAFASEQKALLKAPFIEKEINPSAVFDLFAFNQIESEPESFFKGILELPPSHSFTLDLKNNKLEIWRHFKPEVNNGNEAFLETQNQAYSSEIEKLLLNAIELRLRSDVPVGSCLSGGLDSSSIVCLTNEILRKSNAESASQKVFTTSFKDSPFDESKWAQAVADQTGAEWHQTYPTKNELLDDLEDLVHCQDIPLITTRTYAQYRVMRLINENNIKVVLDGQGGDELFSGYHHHYFPYWMGLFKQGRYNTMINEMRSTRTLPSVMKYFLKSYVKNEVATIIPSGIKPGIHKSKFSEMNFLSNDFFHANIGRYKEENMAPSDSLNSVLSHEFYSGPLKYLLRCEDRCSMRFSVESRTPFSDDRDLISRLFSIPSIYKIQGGVTKKLLRNSMQAHIPEVIANREDKMGFMTPNNDWIREIKDEVRHYFEADTTGMLDKSLILKEYDNYFNPSSKEENFRIFKFMSFVVWLKVFELN